MPPTPYITPLPYSGPKIIGVEVIYAINITKSCHTTDTITHTTYLTSTASTLHRPIWNTKNPGFPCYSCDLSSEGYSYPTSSFITAITTSYFSYPPGYTPAPPPPPIIKTCESCKPITLSACPEVTYTLPSGRDYVVVAPTVVNHVHKQVETTTLSYGSELGTDQASYDTYVSLPTEFVSTAYHKPAPSASYTTSPLSVFTGGADVGSTFAMGGVVGAAMLMVAVAL
jgi:hypothetical protein